jgi:hypothetical protein
MRECHPFLMMLLLDRLSGIERNFGAASPNTNRHSHNSRHLPPLGWLRVCVPIISPLRMLHHLLYPLSLAASTLPSIRHHRRPRSWALRLRPSLPRRKYPLQNRPCLQPWPRRRSFSGWVGLSGRPSLRTRHRMMQIPKLVPLLGTRTRSDASWKGRRF